MPTEFTMPMLGEVMEAGRIVAWRKQVGDTVEKGQAIVEIETDKAVMELESPANGILTKILILEGEIAPVNTVLALIE